MKVISGAWRSFLNFCSSQRGKKFSRMLMAVVVIAIVSIGIVSIFGLDTSIVSLLTQKGISWGMKIGKFLLEKGMEKLMDKGFDTASPSPAPPSETAPAGSAPQTVTVQPHKNSARSILLTVLGWLVLALLYAAMQ